MNSLSLDPGDILQVKSTDLPPGRLVKLQPQSPSFLEISDPRAVLENAFRNFSCLTRNDIFTFKYNDETYDIAVIDVKPDNESHGIVTMETDLEVEFATPVGYKEPERKSGTSTPQSGRGRPAGGPLHFQGTMAQAINYAAIAPQSTQAAAGAKAVSSNFLAGGQRFSAKKGAKAPTPQASTPVAGSSTNTKPAPSRRLNGPQPLRLPPGKLFFGYEVKPVRNQDDQKKAAEEQKPRFQGAGQTLRVKKKFTGAESGNASSVNSDVEAKEKERVSKAPKATSGRAPR